MLRMLIAMALVAMSSSAFANDALKGRWVGTAGSNSVTLIITDAKNGVLTGTIGANHTVSGAPPSATNNQGTFQGNSVKLDGAGGTWEMQLSGNKLTGTWTAKAEQGQGRRAGGRARDVTLTKQ